MEAVAFKLREPVGVKLLVEFVIWFDGRAQLIARGLAPVALVVGTGLKIQTPFDSILYQFDPAGYPQVFRIAGRTEPAQFALPVPVFEEACFLLFAQRCLGDLCLRAIVISQQGVNFRNVIRVGGLCNFDNGEHILLVARSNGGVDHRLYRIWQGGGGRGGQARRTDNCARQC